LTPEELRKLRNLGELVQAIVDRMDFATLWRWKTTIDRRLERSREHVT